mgnify:CR=1 FL=1|jgi:hypothetical protein
MEKDLVKFNEKIEFLNSKDICRYIDEKGNLIMLPLSQLFLSCEFLELEEPQLKIAIFQGEVDKSLEYEKATILRKKDKFEVTKNEKDKGTIIETEVEVSKIWVVRNGLKLAKSYNKMDEAISYVKDYNDNLMKIAKLIEE